MTAVSLFAVLAGVMGLRTFESFSAQVTVPESKISVSLAMKEQYLSIEFRNHHRCALYDNIWQHLGVLLPCSRQRGIPPQLPMPVVLALPMAGQPYLPGPATRSTDLQSWIRHSRCLCARLISGELWQACEVSVSVAAIEPEWCARHSIYAAVHVWDVL